MVRRPEEIIRDMERFIERQKRHYAFRKYSYPVLKRLIEELKEALSIDGDFSSWVVVWGGSSPLRT